MDKQTQSRPEDLAMDTQTALKTIGPITIAVREELSRLGEQHSCIPNSAILAEVLHRKGYRSAYALRVAVTVLNRPFTEFFKRFGLPNTPEAMARCEAAGGIMAKVGLPESQMPEGRWPGHTVVIIPGVTSEGSLMSDTTITQVNHDGAQFDVEPFLAVVPGAFVRGQRKFGCEVSGCQFVYTAMPGDREHEATELWTAKAGIDREADMVMSRL
jgi:hypothetical protein